MPNQATELSQIIISSTWSFSELMTFFLPKVFFAVICGGLIGLEREFKNKPAGIKTNILICMGAAIYTGVSVLISSANTGSGGQYGDPARIAAQIVSGIGFLGGGTIIQSRGTILGLTTAATIWVVAALGVCIGIGHWDIALGCSIMVVLILVLTSVFEDKVLGRSQIFTCEIHAEDPDGKIRGLVNQALSRNELLLDDFDVEDKGGMCNLRVSYNGHRTDHKKFMLELWSTPGIKEVRQR